MFHNSLFVQGQLYCVTQRSATQCLNYLRGRTVWNTNVKVL